MKKTHLLIPACITFVLFSGCTKEPPVASFTMDKESYKIDETITFSNQSVNSKSYVWDFGDGKTSELKSPTHAYSSAGDFTVKLIATGGGGTDSISKPISIQANLSGFWFKTLNFSGSYSFKVTGTMNITQHEDNTLSGSYVYDDGMGTFTLKPTSMITGNSVLIEWNEASYKFEGTINAAGTSMGGQMLETSAVVGTWTAKRL